MLREDVKLEHGDAYDEDDDDDDTDNKDDDDDTFVDDGIKPVFRVTTKLGRFVDTTITHPFLTVNGWKPLAKLQVGEKIAVPRRLNIFGNETIPKSQLSSLIDFDNFCLLHMISILSDRF